MRLNIAALRRLAILGLLVMPIAASGQSTAKYAGEFLSTGAGARALGMGGAHVAMASDVTSVYWNPAGLTHILYPELMLMHAQRFSGIVKYNFAAFAVPYRKQSSLGIGLIRLSVDDIPFTLLPREDLPVSDSNRPFADSFFSDAEYGIFLTYARRVRPGFSYGGSVKVLHKGFADAGAWGVGFDLGAQLLVAGRVLVGANLQDATTTILAWNTGRKELIVPTLKLGVALPVKADALNGRILAVADADVRFEGRDFSAQLAAGAISVDAHAGLEYVFRDRLALRAGTDAGSFSAGAGLRLPRLSADYAFMSHTELGDTHRISLHLTIREERYRR